MADGRSWKYCGFVNACAASREPTTWPLTLIRLPSAWLENASCAKPVKSAGIASPNTSVSTTTAMTDDLSSRSIRTAPRRSARASSAGKTIRPAVRMITPTSRTTNVGPSVRKVPAETGAVFLPASEPARASAASSGAKRPNSRATVPSDAEKLVAP